MGILVVDWHPQVACSDNEKGSLETTMAVKLRGKACSPNL